jgi:hypothetical protein
MSAQFRLQWYVFTVAYARYRKDLTGQLSDECVKSSDWWQTVRKHSGTSKPRSQTDPSCEELADHCAKELTLDGADSEISDSESVDAKSFKSFRIKKARVRKVMNSLHQKKSVNVISSRILKGCSGVLTDPVTSLFSLIARRSEWPKKRKEGRVSPIWKRESRALAKNYRPVIVFDINLSLCFERVVDPQFDQWLYSFIPENQFGFWKKCGTDDY